MNYIILDLEATCWNEKHHKNISETIEIGAICVNEKKEILGEFQTFIKPTLHLQLSDFCQNLTSITQEMVENAPLFPVALSNFQAWIQSFGGEYFLGSWGFYDKSQFQKDCLLHQLDTNWLKNHINIKFQHAQIRNLSKGIGMKAAIHHEKLELDGIHHRGIDDARNIVKIFIKLFDKWNYNLDSSQKHD
ncbi:MAG: 3'-5' exonuclease [Bacteroidetes bacterium]|nr:MAG: 3'-5' exonuclease [Bacteroidota bacterium]TAG87197.1 MAG: 3'-5' exonuclease [Bacteroidota bacterium]